MKKNIIKNVLIVVLFVIFCVATTSISYAESRRIRTITSTKKAGFDFKFNISGIKVKVEKYNTISDIRDNMFQNGCELRISIPVFTSNNPEFASVLNMEVENACNDIMDELLVKNNLNNVNMYELSKCDIRTITQKKMVFWLKGKKTLYGGKTKKVKYRLDFNMEDGTLDWEEK